MGEQKKSLLDRFLEWRHNNPDQPMILTPNTERSIILIMLSLGILLMLYRGMTVPEWFVSIFSMAMGYFFGRAKN